MELVMSIILLYTLCALTGCAAVVAYENWRDR